MTGRRETITGTYEHQSDFGIGGTGRLVGDIVARLVPSRPVAVDTDGSWLDVGFRE